MEQWDVDSLTFEGSGRRQKVAALLIAEFLAGFGIRDAATCQTVLSFVHAHAEKS